MSAETTDKTTGQPARKLLMEPLAIPLDCQKTTAKCLVMAGHPKNGFHVIAYSLFFIRAITLRMCFGLVFAGLAVAAHTAQSREGSFAPDLAILTIQPAHSIADRSLPDRLNTSVALTRSADTEPIDPGFGNTPRSHLVAKPKQETVWPANARWQIAPGSDGASFSPLLRLESKGERIDIKPRRNSIWVVWRKAFP